MAKAITEATVPAQNRVKEVERRIAALKQKKASPASSPRRFDFNPDEPLRLARPEKPRVEKRDTEPKPS